MRLLISPFCFLCCAVFLSSAAVFADESLEEQRLEGFAQHNSQNASFSKRREAKSDEVKIDRQNWETERLKSLSEYKNSKSRQAQSINESSPQYQQDVEFKQKQSIELETSRKEFVAERNLKRQQKKKHIQLSESEELGLDDNPDRVEISKRALYGGKPDYVGKIDFSGGSAAGGARGAPAPAAPPPFFEPEAPPPPPPMAPLPEPVFEDAIPPPIFDDPGEF